MRLKLDFWNTIKWHFLLYFTGKQECFQILHQLPFVDFSRRFVFVNIMGTRKIEENLSQDIESDEDRNVKVAKNIADQYWARETDPKYLKAVEEFEKKSG